MRTLLVALPDLQPETERGREAMNFDEWHEQAGREAYAAFNKTRVYKTVAFDDLNELDQEAWREVARAVLGEGRIEFRRSPELAEQETREENERLVKIAREASEDVAQFRRSLMVAVQVGVRMEDDARAAERERDELRKQVDQYHRSADEHVQKFDRKHAALVTAQQQADTFRQAALYLASGVGREHIRRCEIEQCDTCSDVLGIEERAQSADDVRETTEGNMNAAP